MPFLYTNGSVETAPTQAQIKNCFLDTPYGKKETKIYIQKTNGSKRRKTTIQIIKIFWSIERSGNNTSTI